MTPAFPFALDRRKLIAAMSTLAGASLAPRVALAQLDTPSSEPAFIEADTRSGRIRGLNVSPIKTFKGVPYGATTSGRGRFMPPRAAAAWRGTMDTIADGPRSPQPIRRHEDEYTQMIDWDRNPGSISEDCLVTNVWTPGLNDGVKRPVMVNFHGGGFGQGSGSGMLFDGDALARYGDVVVVSPNHRLGAFGYLNLADVGGGEQFAHASVAGMMDLALLLTWVKDHAATFGGDPGNVLIFGQSGGGAKVSTTLAMPSAKGLFHRAIIQSGSTVRLQDRERAAKTASLLLTELGISRARIADIQRVPMPVLLDAQRRLTAREPTAAFAPIVDGQVVPGHPFDPSAPLLSVDIPLMIGTTIDDAGLRETNFDLTEQGVKEFADAQAPGQGDRVYRAYRQAFPDVTPFILRVRMITDRGGRARAIMQAERKAEQHGAPVWLYRFDWPSPAFGGKFGAVHATEVPLTFHDARALIAGNGLEAHRMADLMASTWVAFARSGNPNNSHIPPWAPFTTAHRQTMVFNAHSQVRDDPNAELRTLWLDIDRRAGGA